MKSKCENCGAPLKNGKNYCEYCGCSYLIESANEKLKQQTPLPVQQSFCENNKNVNERPRFSVFLFIILMFFNVFPAIIYAVIIGLLQRKWDNENNN